MTATIVPVVQFVMDQLRDVNNPIVSMVDNQIFSGMPRMTIAFSAPHWTRVGVDYYSDDSQNQFFSQVRDFNVTNVKMKITVTSANGENENYCKEVINAILALFGDNRKKITETYRIFIDGMSVVFKEDNPERWTGEIDMDIKYLTKIDEDVT